nr:MAG TPA: hypothetical protein [Caudoviricetes sp.]
MTKTNNEKEGAGALPLFSILPPYPYLYTYTLIYIIIFILYIITPKLLLKQNGILLLLIFKHLQKFA